MTADRGFTLIEAVVVLSLVGVAMLFFLQNSILAMGFHERGRKMSEALLLAEERMELLEARGWGRAVEDCAADGAHRYCRDADLQGRPYRLVLERKRVSSSLDYYTVTCYWQGPAGTFSRETSVSLSSARQVLR